jgi:hypothetical protein
VGPDVIDNALEALAHALQIRRSAKPKYWNAPNEFDTGLPMIPFAFRGAQIRTPIGIGEDRLRRIDPTERVNPEFVASAQVVDPA